uniref:Methyl-CpG binding domain protein 3 n=1 Tax=Nothobranchius furzeri TaxID=105023 RepID=A0A8C6P1A7_NOTFU
MAASGTGSLVFIDDVTADKTEGKMLQEQPKPDLNTTLPVRQTASIFKQPVTKVTNHPNNKVKTDPQKAVDQPKQLFWERKLSGLNAFDIAEELVKTMDLPKGLQGVGPACSDKTLLSAIASALHTNPAPITGQLTSAVEKNPGVWLNTAQPLCKAFVVTDDDISMFTFSGFDVGRCGPTAEN